MGGDLKLLKLEDKENITINRIEAVLNSISKESDPTYIFMLMAGVIDYLDEYDEEMIPAVQAMHEAFWWAKFALEYE